MIENDADEAYRNRVKTNYSFSEWAGRVKEGNTDVRLTDFVLPKELSGWNVAEQQELPSSSRQRRVVRYIFSSLREKERLITTIFECVSVNEAHESLIDVVMTYMAPKLPRCETRGLAIGDVCFGSQSEQNSSVIFARFNILAEIQAIGSNPKLADEFASAVDSQILAQFQRTSPSSPGLA